MIDFYPYWWEMPIHKMYSFWSTTANTNIYIFVTLEIQRGKWFSDRKTFFHFMPFWLLALWKFDLILYISDFMTDTTMKLNGHDRIFRFESIWRFCLHSTHSIWRESIHWKDTILKKVLSSSVQQSNEKTRVANRVKIYSCNHFYL